MEEKIRAYVDGIFSNVENTQNVRELKEELSANLIERYHDLLEEGKSEQEAYQTVVQSAGNASDFGFSPKYFEESGQRRNGFGMNVLRECKVRGLVENVDLEWHVGEAQILRSPSDEIRIVQKSNVSLPEDCLFTYHLSGGTLYVKDNNRAMHKGFWGRRLTMEKTYLEFYLPQRMYQKVRLRNASGMTRAQYLEAKELELENASGSMVASGQFSRINAKNSSGSTTVESSTPASVDAENSSGRISLSGKLQDIHVGNNSGRADVRTSMVGKIQLRCNSGKADVRGAFQKVDVRVTSGMLDLETSKMPERLAVDVSSGSATVHMPGEKEGFRMQITKGSGIINSDFPTLYGEGKYEYNVRVTSGMFFLRRL